MDVKPEDFKLNRGNNLISEQRGAHPNPIDETFSCRKERCGGTIGTVIGTRPGLRQRGDRSDQRVVPDNLLHLGVIVNRILIRKDPNPIVMGSAIICEAKPHGCNVTFPVSPPRAREVFWALLGRYFLTEVPSCEAGGFKGLLHLPLPSPSPTHFSPTYPAQSILCTRCDSLRTLL